MTNENQRHQTCGLFERMWFFVQQNAKPHKLTIKVKN